MSWMATALSKAGLLRAYVTPVAANAATRRRVERLPSSLSSRIGRQLALRDIPAAVSEEQVKRAATLSELLLLAVQRSPLPWAATLRANQRRAVVFDKRVARILAEGDSAVIAAANAAVATIQTARRLGVPSFLDSGTAHHSLAERLLREEARLHPELADTLPLGLSPEIRRRLETEVEEADRIIVLTSFHRRTFLEAGVDKSRLVLTPTGVDGELFRPQPRPNPSSFRVLFTGQLSQRKGLSYALEGFRRAALPEAELVLIGPLLGSGRVWKDSPGVHYMGPVNYREMPAQYQASDVYVLPSLVEGLPQTVLEAMASGLPVVVSENTAGPEIVTDGVNGYVVPIRDSAAIAERLRELYEDDDGRRRMGELARKRADELSWDAYGDRLVAAVRSQSGQR
jgi:alpha-maltose-1-phosphate synthase